MGNERRKGKRKCRLCGKLTSTIFNIDYTATPVCDACGLTIAKQEVCSWKEEDDCHLPTLVLPCPIEGQTHWLISSPNATTAEKYDLDGYPTGETVTLG